MFDWLAKKSLEASVVMCMNEVLWDVERASGRDRALLQIKATMWIKFFVGQGFPLAPFKDPRSIPAASAAEAYSLVEGLRNDNAVQVSAMRKNFRQMGMSEPQLHKRQAQLMRRGMELLMVTIGVGILPSRERQVRGTWATLSRRTSDDDAEAISELRSIQERSSIIRTQGERLWLDDVTDEDLMEMSTVEPTFLKY